MLIGIISDSHDNEPNLVAALNYCISQGAELVIHCGDICTLDTLELAAQVCLLPTHVVFGNGDYEREKLHSLTKKYANLTIHGDEGSITIDAVRIGWCHYPEQAEKMALTKKFDAVFHGHTHVPWEKTVGTCVIRNPGTVAGLRNRSTFALFDTKTRLARLILTESI